jgi:hypothetical protein
LIVTQAGRAGSGIAHGHGDNQRPDTAIGQIGVSGLNPFGLGTVRRSGLDFCGSIAFVGATRPDFPSDAGEGPLNKRLKSRDEIVEVLVSGVAKSIIVLH